MYMSPLFYIFIAVAIAIMAGAAIIYIIYTKPDAYRVYGGGTDDSMRSSWFWKIPERYFHMNVIFESEFDKSKIVYMWSSSPWCISFCLCSDDAHR
eukprot:UN08422